MAFIQLDFLSKYLNMHTAVNIALPMPADVSAPMDDIPCIYLLHDIGEDMTSWQRNVPVERYANECGAAIIMPDGALSFYEDMRHGGLYRSYIGSELPSLLRSYFPMSTKKEKNFIAGCGMGGRGAVKIALENPDTFAVAGLFAASHKEAKPCCEAMESALFRAYDSDAVSGDRFIEEKAAAAEMKLCHFVCGNAQAEEVASPRELFENAGGIDYHFEAFKGSDNWAVREKMLLRFIETLSISVPEVQNK